MLKEDFFSALEPQNANLLWEDIVKRYSDKKRYYHNLSHLENMYRELLGCKELLSDWHTVILALAYHDVIYKATTKDNEEQSARYAAEKLSSVSYPSEKIDFCSELIIATKTHTTGKNDTINLFTDADLSILSKPWPEYEAYYKSVRREYAVYPDIVYKPGRKKVLKHFLEMESIFKTGYFRNKYETAARNNITAELKLL